MVDVVLGGRFNCFLWVLEGFCAGGRVVSLSGQEKSIVKGDGWKKMEKKMKMKEGTEEEKKGRRRKKMKKLVCDV